MLKQTSEGTFMVEIKLTLKVALRVPLDVSVISPDNFIGKSLEEIKTLNVWEGNHKARLDDFFEVEGETTSNIEDLTILLRGNGSKFRKLGKAMSNGKIIVDGLAGLYLGEEMSGGTITVNGEAGSWCGTRMKGGLIEVKGNAGDYVGASYRGSTEGMKGGVIIIHGNAGNEVGAWMQNGLIKIFGDVGQFAGIHLQNGTIYILGNSEGRVGAQMKNGKIIILGSVPTILPSFSFEEIRDKVKAGEEKVGGPFYVFSGDIVENGDGRLFISMKNNPHLKFFEKL
jgi:formylmethanofuran dehydrogenase subunit C